MPYYSSYSVLMDIRSCRVVGERTLKSCPSGVAGRGALPGMIKLRINRFERLWIQVVSHFDHSIRSARVYLCSRMAISVVMWLFSQ